MTASYREAVVYRLEVSARYPMVEERFEAPRGRHERSPWMAVKVQREQLTLQDSERIAWSSSARGLAADRFLRTESSQTFSGEETRTPEPNGGPVHYELQWAFGDGAAGGCGP